MRVFLVSVSIWLYSCVCVCYYIAAAIAVAAAAAAVTATIVATAASRAPASPPPTHTHPESSVLLSILSPHPKLEGEKSDPLQSKAQVLRRSAALCPIRRILKHFHFVTQKWMRVSW